MTTQEIFEAGWKFGAENGGASMRDAETAHPEMNWEEVAIFCNGADDGVIGDTWRIEKGREMSTEHNCHEHAVSVKTNGAIGHGWKCSICETFIQAG